MSEDRERVVLAGNSNRKLARSIAEGLDWKFGNIDVKKFSDGETSVEIHTHVRDAAVYVIQSICSPANDNLMELIQITDAAPAQVPTK